MIGEYEYPLAAALLRFFAEKQTLSPVEIDVVYVNGMLLISFRLWPDCDY